jgi:tRNA uridine 5-carboxymethylaminomethyl modification enzyme
VSEARHRAVEEKQRAIEVEIERLTRTTLHPSEALNVLLAGQGIEALRAPISARQLLRRPGVGYDIIRRYAPADPSVSDDVAEQVEISIRYEGYIAKQERQIERARRMEEHSIPADFDYMQVIGIRNEARERLIRHQPRTVGQASRIQGVNPADISVLLVYLERHTRRS